MEFRVREAVQPLSAIFTSDFSRWILELPTLDIARSPNEISRIRRTDPQISKSFTRSPIPRSVGLLFFRPTT